jgi:spermidine synthase
MLVLLQATISASSLVVEIVAGRMLAPYVGMSLYTWTSVIAVVLAGLSAGHWWGGHIAERPARLALSYAGWVIVAAAVTTAGAVLLLRLVAGTVMDVMSDPVWTIALLTFSAFFLPSLFAGVPAPVLAHIAASRAEGGGGRALGAMFAAGALGAIGGTLLAGFVFISWLGTAMTLAIIVGTYLAAAFVLFGLAGRTSPVPQMVVALFAIGLSAVSATRLSPCDVESQYYCIRVVDVSSAENVPVRRMVLDHLAHGTSARDAPRVMFTEFTAMIDAIARGRMEGRNFSAFFIGGGTYSVPRAWADRKTGPITVAEIDPAVTRTAIGEFWLDPSGMEILHEDARRALLRRPSTRYDVIVGDAFADITIPHHLITQEFFELVRSRLSEDGVFLINIIDYPERLMALAAIEATLRTVFPRVEIWTEATLPRPAEQRVFVLAAGNRLTEFDSFTASAPDPKRFAAMSAEFSNRVLKKRAGVILTDDYAPIDRLLAPRL